MNTIVSIPGYVHLYRSLLRFYDMLKLIDFGVPRDKRPYRPHGNDAGADVYMPYDCTLQPGGIAKVSLGFGIEVPDGYAGYVFPRTSMAVKGLVCELPPVDSGYRGEIHAVFSVPTERAAITAGDDLKGFGDMSPTSILEGFTAT